MDTQKIALPKTMQAVMCYGPHDYRPEEVKVPQVGPGEVLVRILAAGICAGDSKCFSGAPLFWGDAYRPGYCQPPVIPGHEFVGEVVALGPGAGEKYGLALGDMATSEQIVPCWECRFCKRGQYWMCDRKHDVYGFRQRTFGAMADYMLFPCGCHQPQDSPYAQPAPGGIHRTPGLRHPRRAARQHRIWRYGRDLRLRASGSGHGRGRPVEEPRPA